MRTRAGTERIALGAIGAGLALGAVPLLSGATFHKPQGASLLLGGALLIAGLILFAAGPPRRITIRERRPSVLAFVLFAVGLGIRIAFVGHMGTGDTGVDLGWGDSVYADGLARAYGGNYFPIEWQIYGSVLAVHYALGIKALVFFKLSNLAFDAAIYFVLRGMLRSWSLNPDLALWYWLTPYFAALDWLGYVDFHLGLLGLLVVWVVFSHPNARGYLVAGIPLGVMFLMKPQAVGLLIALGIWVVVRFALALRDGRREWSAALLFVGPVVLYAVYSVYFATQGFTLAHLTDTYRDIPSFFPALNANMVNIWRIVAELYRHGDQPIYSINDPHAFHPLSQLAGLAIVVLFIVRIATRRASKPPGASILAIFAVSATVSPLVLTQAHENHLYLGGVFLVTLALYMRSRVLLWGSQVLLGLAFINIFGLYGFDNATIANPLHAIYTDATMIVVSALATVVFASGAWWLYRRLGSSDETASAASHAADATYSTSASVSSG
jgi:hypothetical protein